jgi:hypothetical protein
MRVSTPARARRIIGVYRVFNSLDRLLGCCDFAVSRTERAFGQAVWLVFRVKVMLEILRWLHIDRVVGLCLSAIHTIL